MRDPPPFPDVRKGGAESFGETAQKFVDGARLDGLGVEARAQLLIPGVGRMMFPPPDGQDFH